MGTELINKENSKLKRFFGGIDRGVLYFVRTDMLDKEDTIKELENMIKLLENE